MILSQNKSFEEETGMILRVSGMPYIRTLNAMSIMNEISLFRCFIIDFDDILFFSVLTELP
jgi:hypothetical protein